MWLNAVSPRQVGEECSSSGHITLRLEVERNKRLAEVDQTGARRGEAPVTSMHTGKGSRTLALNGAAGCKIIGGARERASTRRLTGSRRKRSLPLANRASAPGKGPMNELTRILTALDAG